MDIGRFAIDFMFFCLVSCCLYYCCPIAAFLFVLQQFWQGTNISLQFSYMCRQWLVRDHVTAVKIDKCLSKAINLEGLLG